MKKTSLVKTAAIGLPYLIGVIVVISAFSNCDFFGLVRVAAVAVLAYLLNQVISLFIRRKRPFIRNKKIRPFFTPPTLWRSFPSDHASVLFAIGFASIEMHAFTGVIILLLAMLNGAARIASHVHDARDILGGMIVGLVVVKLLTYLF